MSDAESQLGADDEEGLPVEPPRRTPLAWRRPSVASRTVPACGRVNLDARPLRLPSVDPTAT